MLGRLRETVTQVMSHLEIRMPAPQAPAEAAAHAGNGATEAAAPNGNGQERVATAAPADDAEQPKVGRNASCPCGSGRKYKHCHGRLN
jgi:preprotein translocase subunit SecA